MFLRAERLHDLADDPHRREDHDVDRRMGVEPEQMLEEHRIAAEGRVEDAEVQHPLGRHQQHGDGDDRRPQDHDETRRVVRPHEQRQPEPRHSGSAHAVDRDDEVQAGQDRGEPGDEDAQRRRHHVRVRGCCAVRGIERPTRVDAAAERGVQRERSAEDVDIPAEQVDARKREILRPDHDRDQEVAEHGRDRRDQKEEDHHHAVHGEHLVVGLRRQQIARRRQQLEPDEHREEAAQREERRDGDQVQQRDALVVLRQQPRLETVPVVEVGQGWCFHLFRATYFSALPPARVVAAFQPARAPLPADSASARMQSVEVTAPR